MPTMSLHPPISLVEIATAIVDAANAHELSLSRMREIIENFGLLVAISHTARARLALKRADLMAF